MKTVYLSGGIQQFHTKLEATYWRKIATLNLEKEFLILNPMRRIFSDKDVQSHNEIVNFDKHDIQQSDIILVNCTKPSWGTAMEIMYAYTLNKFIVSFTGTPFKQVTPWIVVHSTRVCRDLGEAIKYIKKHFPKWEK